MNKPKKLICPNCNRRMKWNKPHICKHLQKIINEYSNSKEEK